MPAPRPLGRFTLVCLGLVLTLLLALPIGVAADATPVAVGASTVFAGNGFTPNENLSFWEAPSNDLLNVTPLGSATADGSGGFSFSITFPSAGQWQVTAYGNTSGTMKTGSYNVGSSTASTATTPSGVIPPGTLASSIGAPITFTGTGFTVGERISLWETAPDATVTALTATTADGTGAFSVSVSFPTAGNWQVTAQGNTSAKLITNSYAVGSTGVSASPVTAPVSSTTAALPPGTLPAGVGAPVTFSSSGFTANERIALWETGPDSVVTSLAGTGSDSLGGVTVSVTFPTAGLWQVTAHGLTSLKEVIGRYSVGTPGVSSATTATTTASGQGFSTVPPIALGSPVTFSGSGFNGGEDIKLWETSPDTTVTSLSDVGADGLGNFTATVTFPSVGNWQVTAHGRDSLREVIGRYTVTSDGTGTTVSPVTPITPASAATAAATGQIVATTTSTTIGFTPTGYTAGELVSVWSTAPDGTVTTLDSTQASSIGQVTVTASFASSGLWQLTVHGRTSGHEVVGRYQVANRT